MKTQLRERILQGFALALLLSLAWCSTARAQTNKIILPGPNILYKGNAVPQAYYLSFPAGVSHFTLQFDSFSGTSNGVLSLGNGAADPSSPYANGFNLYQIACTQNPGNALPLPPSYAPPHAAAPGAPTVLDCPAPASGYLSLNFTSTNTAVVWTITLTTFSTPNNSNWETADPCLSHSIPKLQVSIALSSAATTQLIAGAAGQSIFVCGWSVTINQIITTATTLAFEFGTGGTCSSPTVITGTYGGGGIIAAAPITVTHSTPFAPSNAGKTLCAVSVGTTVNINGTLTYVQF